MVYFHFQKYSRRPICRFLLVLMVLAAPLFFNTVPGNAATSVSASLNPAQFSVDDNAVLNVTVNGSRSADITIPSVSGLSIHRNGQSSRIQIINGTFSSSISYTYIIQADRPGRYTIPPIKVSTDGRTLHTSAIGFQVTQTGNALPNQGTSTSQTTRLRSNDTNKIAFLRIQVQKKKSWVGEVIPIRIKAYFRRNINTSQVSLPSLKGDGIVMPQLDQKPPQTEETVNGVEYSVLTWNTSISAVKEGPHTISLELNATLLMPQRRSSFPGFNDQDFFGNDFFQNFFGKYRRRIVKLTSNSFTLESRQLPSANQPSDFSGAIGHFSLAVKAKPDTVAVGDPITLDMIVSGQGNFDRVETPKFPENPKWKSYPPSSEIKQENDPTKGRKTFEQAIMAKDDSVSEIPSVSFTYFDPTTEKYVTLKSTPIPITVKKSAPVSSPVVRNVSPSPAAPSPKAKSGYHGIAGLAPIHLEMGHLQKSIRPLFGKSWFIAILVLCSVLLLTIFFRNARHRYLLKNPDLQRKKEMNELLTRQMSRLKDAVDRNDSRLFLAVCRKTIQEVLATLWQTKASAITLADLEARLDPSSQLITIFAAAEQDVYASYTLSESQIREYITQLRKELTGLL